LPTVKEMGLFRRAKYERYQNMMKSFNRIAIIAGFGLLTVSQASADLVINGGFETGSFAPDWGTLPVTAIAGAADAHSGSFAAQLGPVTGTIAQFVPVVAGQQYLLDFWAKDNGASLAPQALTITLGFLVTDIVDSFDPTSSYVHHSYTVTAPATGNLPLSFVWADGLKNAFVDDVSLVAVPEPTTVVAGALLLLPFSASTIRSLRRKA